MNLKRRARLADLKSAALNGWYLMDEGVRFSKTKRQIGVVIEEFERRLHHINNETGDAELIEFKKEFRKKISGLKERQKALPDLWFLKRFSINQS